MKKIIYILTVCLISFNSFGSNLKDVSIHNNIYDNVKETKNQIVIKLKINDHVKEYKYSYSTFEQLNNVNFNAIIKFIEKDIDVLINESDCTVTITATVSAGYDSTYVSLTVSMEADCATWKSDLKKLIADLKGML